MLFNSISFILFFPGVCLLYYIIPSRRIRNLFLLLSSFYFYASLDVNYAVILSFCILATYFGALLISKNKDTKRGKYLLFQTVFLNSFILIIFKYFNFLGRSLNSVFQMLGFRMEIPGFDFLLPVGISFYIFKAISYIVDVYKGKINPEKDLICFSLYISFFPQLLAGPIERAEKLIPQFKRKISFNGLNVSSGLKLMMWGFFLKLVFADRASIYVNAVYDNINHQNGTAILIAAILYSIQIYCDFAGYSLISIGAAKVMGYEVMDNFNRPYFASSITEFWKRWHISLTKWLTDYVYIPLGGSRCPKIKTYRNIMITFLVSGLWHGASWTFVIWGGIHGIVQVIERQLNLAKIQTNNKLVKSGRVFITFIIVTVAWMFFRLPTFSDAMFGIYRIFTSVGMPLVNPDALPALEYCTLSGLIIFIKEYTDEYYPNRFKLYHNTNIVIRYSAYIATCMLILAAGVFDDSQFIYMAF